MKSRSWRNLFREHARVLWLTVRFFDVAMIVTMGTISFYWRFESWYLPHSYRIAVVVAALIGFLVFPVFGLYGRIRGRGVISYVRRILSAGLVVAAMLVMVAFIVKISTDYSRQWAMQWWVASFVSIVVSRFILIAAIGVLRRHGWNHRQIAIVGAGTLGRNVARQLRQSLWGGFDVVCYFDDDSKKVGKRVRGAIVLSLSTVVEVVQTRSIEEVWLALPLRAESRMRDIFVSLRGIPVDIRFVPDIYGFQLLNHSMTEVAGIPVLDLMASPMTGEKRLLKALEDYVIAVVSVIFCSPLLIAIAIGIKLSSPGPILFKQKRHGWDGQLIDVFKFRTMRVHVENEGAVTQATKRDPRVTSFGRLLRRTSLDELPQFFNVLRGEMSIVGPRPHAVMHNVKYAKVVDGYSLRQRVKPGITGWAQVNGWRGETDTLSKMQERIRHDLYYINHWSLAFDFKIIFLTVIRGLVHKNAY